MVLKLKLSRNPFWRALIQFEYSWAIEACYEFFHACISDASDIFSDKNDSNGNADENSNPL